MVATGTVQTTEPTQDERLMAALAHSAILLPFWGLILSGVIWVTQRDESPYVRQQGVQALGWQVAQLGIFFIGFGCYFITFFAAFLLAFITSAGAEGHLPFFPLFPIIPFTAIGFVMLSLFVFIVIGLFAAVQVLQGKSFTYPIVGRRVNAFLD